MVKAKVLAKMLVTKTPVKEGVNFPEYGQSGLLAASYCFVGQRGCRKRW